ncbi:uncharacterized protein N7498_007881 [Penicillium cinerascens]|uniref:Uncharacterized protein n=1 Tax=Penicillium cinerascens TaxID=70096 RepID=A0A9W9JKT9_9EURO|nr:uncharacterized protein N7498_007881 [Penicillium cinerascens]KAJ5198764.1 hypothetical protein N7498_007881 [Penicillium cinerascens]
MVLGQDSIRPNQLSLALFVTPQEMSWGKALTVSTRQADETQVEATHTPSNADKSANGLTIDEPLHQVMQNLERCGTSADTPQKMGH